MVAEARGEHRAGRGGRHAGLHEPGAGGGRGGRPPERPLRAGRRRPTRCWPGTRRSRVPTAWWSPSTSPSGRRRSTGLRPALPASAGRGDHAALEKQPAERWQTRRGASAGAGRRATRFPRRAAGVRRRAAGARRRGARADRRGGRAGPPQRRSSRPASIRGIRSWCSRSTTCGAIRSVDWLRDGSVSMLGLNLSQWNDLTVVDHERLHDLLARHEAQGRASEIGLDMARRLAREAGVWTVVLGDFTTGRATRSISWPGSTTWPAASGWTWPGSMTARATTCGRCSTSWPPSCSISPARRARCTSAWPGPPPASLEAFRAYLVGWSSSIAGTWPARNATCERAISIDTTFGLAYYKLALTRGWLAGTEDSIADRAIVRATTYSGNLPVHERTVINAYRAFLAGEYAEARSLYQQLIARDPGDADAWYGLGEAWFHDTTGVNLGTAAGPQAIRAFKRALAARSQLRPGLRSRADHAERRGRRPAAVRAAPARLVRAHPRLDRTTAAGQRHRAARGAAGADRGAGQRPDLGVGPAHHAPGPRGDGGRLRRRRRTTTARHGGAGSLQALATPLHPELPFVEARIRFASGRRGPGAAAQLRTALDTVAPQDFRPYQGTPTVVSDIAAAANVFAYQGDLTNAAKALDLADQVRREVIQHPGAPGADGRILAPGRCWASSTPRSGRRRRRSARSGRAPLRRPHGAAGRAKAHRPQRRAPRPSGSSPALAADTTALIGAARLISGDPPPRKVRALLAVSRGDSAAARRTLAEPDSSTYGNAHVHGLHPSAGGPGVLSAGRL